MSVVKWGKSYGSLVDPSVGLGKGDAVLICKKKV